MYGFVDANHLNKKAILTYLFICGLFIDFILLVLTFNHYYFMFLKTSDYMPVVFMNFILYLLLLIISKQKFWKIFWGLAVPLLASPIIMTSIIFPPSFNYYDLDAPENNETLIIEHRNRSLGETNHLYNFYRKTTFPGLVKQVNGKTIEIMTRFTDADDLEVLGVKNAEWEGAKKVVFHSTYAETSIELK
jgi:hypothetical protein